MPLCQHSLTITTVTTWALVIGVLFFHSILDAEVVRTVNLRATVLAPSELPNRASSITASLSEVSEQATSNTALEVSASVIAWAEDNIPQEDYPITWESDFDSDGMVDCMEFYAGTDPANGRSLLKINGLVVTEDKVTITWASTRSTDPARREYIVYGANAQGLDSLLDASLSLQQVDELSFIPTSGVVFVGRKLASESDDETSIEHDVSQLGLPQYYRVFLTQPLPHFMQQSN